MSISRRTMIQGLAALGLSRRWVSMSRGVSAQEQPATVRLDYAYYNPSSLALRRFGWLEEALQEQGIGVEWVLSAGSNKANEYLRSEAVGLWIDGRGGGAVGACQWLADQDRLHLLQTGVDGAGSAGQFPDHLGRGTQGEEVAATKGTDPYFFLLRP